MLPARKPRSRARWERASALAGLPEAVDQQDAITALAWAVGLEPTASRVAVATRCRERGDLDLANLLDPWAEVPSGRRR